MNQEVSPQQEARDVIAPRENSHPLGQPERSSLAQKLGRIVLADDKQACPPAQRLRQSGKCLDAAIKSFGLEARANLQQQQILVAQAKLAPEVGTQIGGIRRRFAVARNPRRQEVKPRRRSSVMPLEKRLLQLRDHQNFSTTLRSKHRPLVGRKMPVARAQAIQRIAQLTRFFLETPVCSKIDVQARHLVETDDPINRRDCQICADPVAEFLVAPDIAPGPHRYPNQVEARGHIPFPIQRIHSDRMPACLAGQCNAQKIALQPTKGKIFIETESEFHQSDSGAGSVPRRRL